MFTISKPHRYIEEIKKSRFIANAIPVETVEQALAQIESIRDQEATHNCWAYQIEQEYRFSDDGEPGGTAGRPILGAIQAQDMNCVLVVVTRFFGGIKLGAGGLARAYGGTAAKCLNEAPKKEIEHKATVEITVSFGDIGAVYLLIDQTDARKTAEAFTESGVTLTVEISEKSLADFTASLQNATKGRAKWKAHPGAGG